MRFELAVIIFQIGWRDRQIILLLVVCEATLEWCEQAVLGAVDTLCASRARNEAG